MGLRPARWNILAKIAGFYIEDHTKNMGALNRYHADYKLRITGPRGYPRERKIYTVTSSGLS